MAANSRMTIGVHALAWMALAQRQGHAVLTSDQVAASVNTNLVIIRRCVGDLRRAGLVTCVTVPGRGGAWPGLLKRSRCSRCTMPSGFGRRSACSTPSPTSSARSARASAPR